MSLVAVKHEFCTWAPTSKELANSNALNLLLLTGWGCSTTRGKGNTLCFFSVHTCSALIRRSSSTVWRVLTGILKVCKINHKYITSTLMIRDRKVNIVVSTRYSSSFLLHGLGHTATRSPGPLDCWPGACSDPVHRLATTHGPPKMPTGGRPELRLRSL